MGISRLSDLVSLFLVKFGLMIGSPLELAIGRLFTVTLTLQGIELPAIVY